MYKSFLKRVIDFLVSFVALVLLCPLLLVLTLFLTLANQGKPFFFQLRPGKNGKIFKIVKFKTMNDKKDALGNLLPDAERLTKIGAFVRKTSLDEIPQLVNVIKGDMSVIGPRPLLPDYLPFYSSFQNRRHEIKPGITGWAQVNGRNAISWEEKFNFDVWYVDNINLVLDFKIIFLTFEKIFKTSEISSGQHATMPRFDKKNKW